MAKKSKLYKTQLKTPERDYFEEKWKSNRIKMDKMKICNCLMIDMALILLDLRKL